MTQKTFERIVSLPSMFSPTPLSVFSPDRDVGLAFVAYLGIVLFGYDTLALQFTLPLFLPDQH